MSSTPKTIQIFLPGGDPQGIRVAEITTRIVQVIDVPRSLLSEFINTSESDQVAVYFLFGENDEGDQTVYIGQTGNLRDRLKKHNKDKDFWERAFVVVSRTNSLTQTHALFLEWHCLKAARKAARYTDENGNSGSKPHTPAPLEADCFEIFDTAKTLLATLGFPVFDAVASAAKARSDKDLFYCTSAGTNGKGLYTSEGFVVLKGSVGRRADVPSIVGTAGARLRQRLIDSGVMLEEGETVVFQKDHLFRSPSMAALSLLGRTANGWVEWKSSNGETLHALKRQTDES